MLSGVFITLHPNLWVKIIGIAIFTYGFFAGHSIASSWVGRLAVHDKAQASALYLSAYYAGSSVGGTVSGSFYHHFEWSGVVWMIVTLSVISIGISMRLGRRNVAQS